MAETTQCREAFDMDRAAELKAKIERLRRKKTALLAQSRMAEVEGQQNLSTGQTSGKFGDDFPDYSWTVGITQPPGPGSSYLRKIEVTVIHDYYPNRPYKVILYRPITLQQ